MKYICKVFTLDFKAKLDAEIERELNNKLDGCVSTTREHLSRLHRIRIRESFHIMWNHPEIFDNYPEVKEYYQSIGLWTPEFMTMTLLSSESGYQSRARIIWEGEVKKIDDIEDIFSYEQVD